MPDIKKTFKEMTPKERIAAVQAGYNDWQQDDPMAELVQEKLKALQAVKAQEESKPLLTQQEWDKYNQVRKGLLPQAQSPSPRDVLNPQPVDTSDQDYNDLMEAFGSPEEKAKAQALKQIQMEQQPGPTLIRKGR